jgi:hypothetical protein
MMQQNDAVEITPAANGFVVRGRVSPGYEVTTDSMMVFQSFKELEVWLKEHFTHREQDLLGDA